METIQILLLGLLGAYWLQIIGAICLLIDGDFYSSKSDFFYALNPFLIFIVIWNKLKELE